MAKERNLRDPHWEKEQTDKITDFLRLLYTDLKAAAKSPMATQKLKVTGLPYVYWEAVKKLGIIRLSGERKSLVGYWGSPAPDYDLAKKVLEQVRLIWANNKQEERDRDAAGVSKRKLIPITVRKKHNPGTIFIALEQLHQTQPTHGYTAVELAERAIKHEMPENFFESVTELGFLHAAHGNYRFTMPPTQELADILYDEIFSGRKRSRAEMYNDVNNCLNKLWDLFKGKTLPVDSSVVNDILTKMKFDVKMSCRIRQGCLVRVKNDTGQRGVVRYAWKTDLPAPDLDLAIRIYHGTDETPQVNKAVVNTVSSVAEAKSAQHEAKADPSSNMDLAESLRAKLLSLGTREQELVAELEKIRGDKYALEKVLQLYS